MPFLTKIEADTHHSLICSHRSFICPLACTLTWYFVESKESLFVPSIDRSVHPYICLSICMSIFGDSIVIIRGDALIICGSVIHIADLVIRLKKLTWLIFCRRVLISSWVSKQFILSKKVTKQLETQTRNILTRLEAWNYVGINCIQLGSAVSAYWIEMILTQCAGYWAMNSSAYSFASTAHSSTQTAHSLTQTAHSFTQLARMTHSFTHTTHSLAQLTHMLTPLARLARSHGSPICPRGSLIRSLRSFICSHCSLIVPLVYFSAHEKNMSWNSSLSHRFTHHRQTHSL